MQGKEQEVGTFEAKNTLSALVERAAKGDRIWITKRGRRVALLSSGSESGGSGRVDLAASFRSIRSKARGSASLRDLIEEGRK